jgi:predicted Zn-dependent protease
MLRLFIFLLLTALASTQAAMAHEGIHERLQKAGQSIQKDPANPRLYLLRAELYRQHQDWPEARADLNRARDLAPESAALLLEEAHWFAARGQRLQALQNLKPLTDAVQQQKQTSAPSSELRVSQREQSSAWILRAHLLLEIKQPQAAADAMATAIGLVEKAEPDHFHFRARCLLQLGSRGIMPALECAQQGVAKLGACVSLELLAVDLECRLGRCNDAISRLQRLSRAAKRKESWLVQMGDVYFRSGRRAEARKQYQAALHAIQRLRPRTQNTPAVKKLRLRASNQLAMLAP